MALRKPEPAQYAIRPAETGDLDEIARIERASFRIPWKREFFESELREPYRFTRVLGGDPGLVPRIAGYLFAVSLYEEFHINKIATDPRVRHRGLGRRLLEDAIVRARNIGAESVTLEVRLSNLPARRLYEKYGFRPVGLRPRYYSDDNEDALIMTTEPLSAPQMQQRIDRLRGALDTADQVREPHASRPTGESPERT